MAKPLTDDERQQIQVLLEEGHSARQIADTVGRSVDTVSRIAKATGHRFGQTNVARAHEARSAYCAERRAEIAARATERVEAILDRFEGQFLVFNFGGKDNTYEEHMLERPPVEAQRAMAQTVRDLMRTVLDIDRHDRADDEATSAVAEWLRAMTGSSS